MHQWKFPFPTYTCGIIQIYCPYHSTGKTIVSDVLCLQIKTLS
jgi:hypothetical protein